MLDQRALDHMETIAELIADSLAEAEMDTRARGNLMAAKAHLSCAVMFATQADTTIPNKAPGTGTEGGGA